MYISAMTTNLGGLMIYEFLKNGLEYEDFCFSLSDCYGDLKEEDVLYDGVRVGRFTYGYTNLLSVCATPIAVRSIGRFCSINSTARIWLGHSMDSVSTFPFFMKPFDEQLGWMQYAKDVLIKYEKTTEIGNDVWIGAGAIIIPGIKIGDGAVIGVQAVVTHDVEPYSVVGGVPARHIKYRFSENIIKKLLVIRWWDWDVSLIKQRLNDFSDIEAFVNKYFKD